MVVIPRGANAGDEVQNISRNNIWVWDRVLLLDPVSINFSITIPEFQSISRMNRDNAPVQITELSAENTEKFWDESATGPADGE